jgi:O-antigen/teichoic acid export membrane protein
LICVSKKTFNQAKIKNNRMSEIRVNYSGLISFGTGLINLCTGLIFIIIVTRLLSQQDYGTWGLISSLFVYGTIISSLVTFWTTRDIARGEKIGKTSMMSNGLFSTVGLCVYLVISFFVAPQSLTEINFFIIAGIFIPINFFNKAISNINKGWKPQLTSYGVLIYGIASIPLALFFIYFLNWSVIGIILSISIAQSINIIFQVICGRKKIKGKIDFKILKRWMKFSWVAIYPRISFLLHTSDVVIFSLITGSVIGISYYSAAIIIASLVGYASGISGSIYPKLLSGDKGKIISNNLTLLSYVVIPMLFLTITFAKPGLFLLNPIYEIAVLVVVISSFRILLFNLNGIFESFIIGVENVDKELKSTFKDYIKSKLFFIPTLRLIQYAAYVIVLAIVLVLLNNSSEDIELVIYWSIIAMIFQIPLTLYLLYKVKQTFQLKFNINSITKYLIASSISFSFVYFLMEEFLTYNKTVLEFMPQVLIFIFLSFGIYLLITFFIDKPTKDLIKNIISEVKR